MATFKGNEVTPAIKAQGLKTRTIIRNPTYAELYDYAMNQPPPAEPGTLPTVIGSTGALCAYSGKRTGRSPEDKRIVCDDLTKDDVWWGKINMKIEATAHNLLKSVALNYLNVVPKLYIIDGYAGFDSKYRMKFRCFVTRPYHAIFMKNMLIRPTEEELQKDFSGDVDFCIFNAGELSAPNSSLLAGVNPKSDCCVTINFTDKNMVILGSQYAGEMKKGVFTIMNFWMPKKGVASLHTSCNEGKEGDITLLFGLSGTGKTTLSADSSRKLLGDDEHCWSEEGVFNIEGGCYAKCINLAKETEPEIYNAIRYGAIMENVVFKD